MRVCLLTGGGYPYRRDALGGWCRTLVEGLPDITFDLLTVTDREPTAATAYALPALEVVDSRIADWKISIYDTVADNASSGVFVLGTHPVRLRDFDPVLCGMVVEYRGEPVSTGAGMACLGNPLNAAVWLADTMARRGHPLRAGDVVLTGALGPVVPVPFGESLQLKINGLGGLTAHFSSR